jgi:hypothetical protein
LYFIEVLIFRHTTAAGLVYMDKWATTALAGYLANCVLGEVDIFILIFDVDILKLFVYTSVIKSISSSQFVLTNKCCCHIYTIIYNYNIYTIMSPGVFIDSL